jgi:hypothetical protein
MSESLIDQHPRIIEWNAKRQALDDAERASRERVEGLMRPYHEAASDGSVRRPRPWRPGWHLRPSPSAPTSRPSTTGRRTRS